MRDSMDDEAFNSRCFGKDDIIEPGKFLMDKKNRPKRKG